MVSLHRPESGDPAAQLERALAYLRRFEVRRLEIDGETVVGIWSDQDSPIIRKAMRVVGWGNLPVRYLDSSHVPDRYKGSRLTGQPLPLAILHVMQAVIDREPWRIRDQLLHEWECGRMRPW
jgi:hypothetical protein